MPFAFAWYAYTREALGDLATRHHNLVDKYTPQLYARLRDANDDVRHTYVN